MNIKKKYILIVQIIGLAGFTVIMLFMWQGNKGFSLWDEGFLWYGAQRVMVGEVPIRDFFSYDPGRYYWSAAFMSLLGNNGIMALRSSVAIFQALGLFVGLLLISPTWKKQSILYLILVDVVLVMWMFPRHKLFDITLSLLLIGVLAFWVHKPTTRRYFVAGLCVGLVAVFGRNHGVYGFVAGVGVIGWLNVNKGKDGPWAIKGGMVWLAGVIVGFMPILLMMILVPGFAVVFWESICFLLESKATNLPLPIPWPWLVDFGVLSLFQGIRALLIGLFFVGLLVFGVLSVCWVVWQKNQGRNVPPVLVAAAFLTLPYAHHAYSRADVNHLAQGLFPLLVGCLVFLTVQSVQVKWCGTSILVAASFLVMLVLHPGWQCLTGTECVSVEISGNNLLVSQRTARNVALLRELTDQYAQDGQSFIVTPFWPGAYPLLERKSPMWETYALFPRSPLFEQSEIERIKKAKPGFALIFDYPLDGRDELRFSNTHPLTCQYIQNHFDELSDSPKSYCHIYKEKEN